MPLSNATVLLVASGTTTATVSPALPAEIIITGPASPFQSVFPEGPEGKTGGSVPRADSDLPRSLPLHATTVMSSSIGKQRLVIRGIMEVICRRLPEASRVRIPCYVMMRI